MKYKKIHKGVRDCSRKPDRHKCDKVSPKQQIFKAKDHNLNDSNEKLIFLNVD